MEPFVSERWSVPMSLGIASYSGFWHEGAGDGKELRRFSATIRVGMRYRLGSHVTLGAGLSSGVHRLDHRWCDEECSTSPEYDSGAQLDFEWSVGRRWRHVSLSFAQRLLWDVRFVIVFHLLSEVSLAWYPAGADWALTLSAFGGLSIPPSGWGGGSLGVAVLF